MVDHVYVFLCMVLLTVRMVADVTETLLVWNSKLVCPLSLKFLLF